MTPSRWRDDKKSQRSGATYQPQGGRSRVGIPTKLRRSRLPARGPRLTRSATPGAIPQAASAAVPQAAPAARPGRDRCCRCAQGQVGGSRRPASRPRPPADDLKSSAKAALDAKGDGKPRRPSAKPTSKRLPIPTMRFRPTPTTPPRKRRRRSDRCPSHRAEDNG